MSEKLITPREVAALLGISMATVNYYTNLGLLKSEERKGNMRLYIRENAVRRFARIRELRKQGYSLKLISHHL
jgi:DNA-binding transcriptional MerR regulator